MPRWIVALVDIIILGIVWSVVISKLKNIRNRGSWTLDRLALSVWMFSLFFAISMTFQVQTLFTIVDRTTFNNLSWFFSYVSLVIALSIIVIAMLNSLFAVHTYDERSKKWVKYYFALTLAILGILYCFSISRLPENIERNFPSTLTELSFMGTMYVYGMVLCAISVYIFYRQIIVEKVISTRLRTMAMLAVSTLAFLAFWDKALIALFGYYKPDYQLGFLIGIYEMFILIGGIIWLSTFLPNKLYMFLAKPWMFINDWGIYKDLKSIPAKINSFYPYVKNPGASFWDFIENPTYHLYCMTIIILDGRVMLSDLLSRKDTRSPASGWDAVNRLQIEQLNQLLSIDSNLDFWEMVQTFRNVAKEIKGLNTQKRAVGATS